MLGMGATETTDGAVSPAPSPSGSVMAENARVLVVDDDAFILEFVAMVLNDEGYAIVTAANGQQALDLVRAEVFDLILLDMRMPVMDGWEFAAALQHEP